MATERTTTATTAATTHVAPPNPHVWCATRRGTRSCGILASWFPAGSDRDGLCSWHTLTQHNPRFDTFDEFERWCLSLRDRGYCALWTHWSPAKLWDLVNGQESEYLLRDPKPCARGGCWFHPCSECGQTVRACKCRRER